MTVPDAFAQRLAHALLARAERSNGAGPVRLPLDRRTAPELHNAADADQLQLLVLQIEELCRGGQLALRLDAPRAFAGFTDRNPRLELLDFDALAAATGFTPQAQRWQRQWLAHLAARWAPSGTGTPPDVPGLLDYLARNPLTALDGLPLDAASQSLEQLHTLCRAGKAMALREASARVFQGRAKLLDSREELLRLLGATAGQFSEPPVQLLLAPPASGGPFTQVLFVENLVSFEHMADTRAPAWRDSLLVYAAGFRGSARRLRSRSGCRLYLRAGVAADSLPAVERWLFDGEERPVHFFGDLDFAGMAILASLREVFAQAVAWTPGYRVLAELLAQGGGHTPELAAKTRQDDPGTTGCPYADVDLLPLMRAQGRFVDQEVFDLSGTPDAIA